MESRPSGTVTFLFTDIEGSTRRWEAEPSVMEVELAGHDKLLGSVVAAHGGWLFKHTGDGICAAFASPHAALAAAVDAQRQLTIPVRMGIATGEASARGGDYFGPALNRTARVMSAGHGGQVLVSASSAALLDGEDLLDLGEHRLRDLSGSHRLYQVRAEGLRREFPPLRTLDATLGNLPAQPTSFVGRDVELGQVVAAVRERRVVTLTGVGGVGKTRLALQAAGQLVPEFPDGVWLVELAAVGDPVAVPDAVANTLAVTPAPGASMSDRVAERLAGRRALLVLDNCEHLLDAVASLVEIIHRRDPAVHVLMTSREGLGLAGEYLWPVPSLPVGDNATPGAVELFVERARAVLPSFACDGDEDVVVDICRRLDGIPLAIELAAARTVSMTPSEIRGRLNDRFRLLAGSRRGLERHQTLRHAMRWSYDLLVDVERAVLNRSAVFSGGFDLPAAVAVCGADELDDVDVLDAIDSLVRKSLVNVERAGGASRYTLLETVRQFAGERLVETGEHALANRRHALYYSADATIRWHQFFGPEQRESVVAVDREFANLRSAFRWALDDGDIDAAASIAVFAAAAGAWGYQRWEGISWAEEALPMAQASGWPRLPMLLSAAGMCGFTAGRIEDGIRYGEQAVSLADDAAFVFEPDGREWSNLAANYMLDGRMDDARRTALELLRRTGDPLVMGRCTLLWLGESTLSEGDDVVRAARASGWPYGLSYALLARGCRRLGTDVSAARLDLDEALSAARLSACSLQIGAVAETLGWAEVIVGQISAGLGRLRESLDIFDRGLNRPLLLNTLAITGLALAHIGDVENGARLKGAGQLIGSPLMWATLEPTATALERDVTHDVPQLISGGAALSRQEAVTLARTAIDSALSSIDPVGPSRGDGGP